MLITSTVLIRHADDASKAFPVEHVLERLVDLRERHGVRDELLQFKFLRHATHRLVDISTITSTEEVLQIQT